MSHRDESRGTGRTTKQIRGAPRGAVFVWCNCAIDYPKGLAAKLGRDDVRVVPLSWLKASGLGGADVVVDHAAQLTTADHETPRTKEKQSREQKRIAPVFTR